MTPRSLICDIVANADLGLAVAARVQRIQEGCVGFEDDRTEQLCDEWLTNLGYLKDLRLRQLGLDPARSVQVWHRFSPRSPSRVSARAETLLSSSSDFSIPWSSHQEMANTLARGLARRGLEATARRELSSKIFSNSFFKSLGLAAADLVTPLIAPALHLLLYDPRHGRGLDGRQSSYLASYIQASKGHEIGADALMERLFCRFPTLILRLPARLMNIERSLLSLCRQVQMNVARLRDLAGEHTISSLCRISGPLGDSHAGGKAVHLIEFESGNRIVCKWGFADTTPIWRLAINEAAFVDASLQIDVPLGFASGPIVFQRFIPQGEGHGEASPINRAAAWGGLLGLAHFFQATDLHEENVRVSGGRLFVVDLESMMTIDFPLLRPSDGARMLAGAQMARSCLRTGLLPQWYAEEPSRAVGWGGMRADPTLLSMRSEELDDCIKSYGKIMRHLIQAYSSDELRDRLANAAQKVRSRLLLRPTALYYRLAGRLGKPDTLSDGRDFACALEVLVRAPFAGDLEMPVASRIVNVEQRAMIRGDIPFFAMSPISPDHRLTPLPGTGSLPISRIENLIERGTDEVLAESDGVIRSAIVVGRQSERLRHVSAGERAAPFEEMVPGLDIQPTQLLEEALRDIETALVLTADRRSVSVVSLEYDPAIGGHRLAPGGTTIYGGLPGMIWACAWAASVLGDQQRTDDYCGLLLRSADIATASLRGVGLFDGRSGIAYLCANLPSSRQRADGLALATNILHQCWRDVEAGDMQEIDLIGGIAGLLLASAIPGIVDFLGQPLKAAAEMLIDRLAQPPADSVNCGLGHGRAGLALAASRYLVMMGEEDCAWNLLIDAIRLCSVQSDDKIIMNTWCSGPLGGAVLAAELPSYKRPTIASEIERIVRTAKEPPVCHLCCGSMGIAHILRIASSALPSDDLCKMMSNRMLSRTMRRLASEAGPQFHPDLPPRSPHYGLMQGHTGVLWWISSLLDSRVPDLLVARHGPRTTVGER